MAKIIPPRRDEILSKEGIGELRFLNYLEENANQTNTTTDSMESDQVNVNLSNAQLSQINKKIDSIVNESLIAQNAIISKLNKKIENLENVILTNGTDNLKKQINKISNDFVAPFYKTKYEKLQIKTAEIVSATITSLTAKTAKVLNDSGSGVLTLENPSSTLTTSDIVGRIDFFANDASTNGTGSKVRIEAIVEDATGTIVGLSLGTSDAGSSVAIERVRIQGNGLVEFLVAIRVLGNINTTNAYSVDGIQVVSNQGAAVPDASGGATIDVEGRAATNALLARLRTHGLIA